MAIVDPNDFFSPYYSIAEVGPAKSGKSQAVHTLWNWCQANDYKGKMEYFDLDDDGADPVLRYAIAEGWYKQINLHRYKQKFGDRMSKTSTPERSSEKAQSFINEFAALYDDVDERTGLWLPGKERSILVFDSFTALHEILFDFILRERRKEIGGGSGGSVEFNEWGLLKAKEFEAIQSAKGLPAHQVFIFHQEIREEVSRGASAGDGTAAKPKTTGITSLVPIICGDLRWSVLKNFSVVLFTAPDYKWVTKSMMMDSKFIMSAGSRAVEGLPALIDQDFSKVLPARRRPPQ